MIYLNNGATSWPKPPCVAEAVWRAVASVPGAAHRGGIENFDVFDASRERLARLLGVSSPSNIALGPNATYALNLAIYGFPLSGGDTVLTTEAEHNSVLRPLSDLSRRVGINVVYLETDETGRVSPELWAEALERHSPRLAVFSHASNVTGAANDAAALCAAAKAAGASVLVDLSQTAGFLPVDLEDWGADMAAFTGHKYLLGPQGTGGLYVRPGLELRPHLTGGTGVMSDLDHMPDEMPLHLEAGTGNEPGFHGLLAALDWAEENPCDVPAVLELLSALRSGLTAAGARVIAPEGECTPVVSFTVPGVPASEIGYMLSEGAGIVCRTGLHCAPRVFRCLGVPETVRLSLSRFTTELEVEETVAALSAALS